MTVSDSVSAGISAIQTGEVQVYTSALTQCYNDGYGQGLADQKAADGSQTSPADQAVIDGLNKQVSDLTAKDAADVASLQTVQGQLSDLQNQFQALTQKEASEAAIIQGLTGSISTLQNVISQLQSVLNPPAPQPAPAPSQPSGN